MEEALANSRLCAIVGEAGTGKTTLLQWMAVNSAANTFGQRMNSWQNTIPFVIELRQHPDGPPPIDDFVKLVVPEIADRMPKLWTSNVLKSGRGLLLVDGLDEVPVKKREGVLNWLERLIETHPLKVVFTTRPGAREWRELVDYLDFRYYGLAPMTTDHIQLFIEHWHKAVLGEQELESRDKIKLLAEKLFFKIQNSTPLMRLSTNPLLCAMLCALHYERQMQLPADRSALCMRHVVQCCSNGVT